MRLTRARNGSIVCDMKKRVSLDRAIVATILTQCFGLTSGAIFGNGFLTSWFKELGVESSTIMFLLSLQTLSNLVIGSASAFLADKLGKKRIGYIGAYFSAFGIFLFSLPYYVDVAPESALLLGILNFSFGTALFGSSWFGLLSGIIPKSYRGRYFGKLRTSWQVVNIILTFIIFWILRNSPTHATYAMVITIISIVVLLRIAPYSQIPERRDKAKGKKQNFIAAIRELLAYRNYVKLLLVFLIQGLLCGAVINLVTLLEKDVLNFSGDQVVLVGAFLFVGALIGYIFGGSMTDKFDRTKIFIWTLVFMMLTVGAFPLHHVIGFKKVFLAFLLCCYGAIGAIMGIVMSAQLFTVMPNFNRSLASYLSTVTTSLGLFLSGIISAAIVRFFTVRHETMFPIENIPLSIYDLLLLFIAGMILLSLRPIYKLLK